MLRQKPVQKNLIGVLVILGCLMVVSGVMADVNAQVKTDKDTYLPGEKIRVNFFRSPGHASDWICIAPAGSPDTEAGDYQYMPKGLEQGVLTFESPSLGKYEARAYYNYRRNGYVVSARYGFSVVSSAPVVSGIAPHVGTHSDTEKAPSAAYPDIKAASGTMPRINVAVFRFMPLNMEASTYGITITSTLINAPKIQSSFTVLDKKDLETFLVANDLQQNDQTDNVVNIGTKIGLNYVIAGSIEKKGMTIITNTKVISIEKKKVIFANRSASVGEADLIGNIMKMSDAMIDAIRQNSL